ncbi:MAG: inositol monophosphatase, partial [Planctomycetaceae bacterium]|nr:inositol monophosphatase [Planctomycetaceae bacterium]
MSLSVERVVEALRRSTPSLLRWSGAIAKQLRQFNIALDGKSSGNANTDALTLADLTVQELVVAGLRDADPILRECRLEAEEANGDLSAFATDAPLTIALDPIDGTKQFRDRSGDGYAVMIHLRDDSQLYYSLVFAPESGPTGTWTQTYGTTVKTGSDDTSKTAFDCLEALPLMTASNRQDSKKIYLIRFQKNDP